MLKSTPLNIAICANGLINDYTTTREKLQDANYLIACDGGLRHFPLLGLSPDCLIGDFDSAPSHLLGQYRTAGIPILPFPPEKDETDLALAVAHACSLNPAMILILGALGGRLDHALGNIHVLAQTGDIPTFLWDESTQIQLIRNNANITKSQYNTISLIPLTSMVTGITTRGLRYPLYNEALKAGEVRGISNTFLTDIAHITIKSGLLITICAK